MSYSWNSFSKISQTTVAFRFVKEVSENCSFTKRLGTLKNISLIWVLKKNISKNLNKRDSIVKMSKASNANNFENNENFNKKHEQNDPSCQTVWNCQNTQNYVKLLKRSKCENDKNSEFGRAAKIVKFSETHQTYP